MIKLKRRRTRIALAKYLFLELQQNYCNLLSSITTNDNWWECEQGKLFLFTETFYCLRVGSEYWTLTQSLWSIQTLYCCVGYNDPLLSSLPRQDELVAISNYLRFHSMDTLATADNYLNLIHFVLDNPGCVWCVHSVLRPGHRSLHCSSDHWYWSE